MESAKVEGMKWKLMLAICVLFTSLSAAPAPPVTMNADLSERTLDVYLHREPVESFMVAIGKKTYPTPTGSFKVWKVIWNPDWVPPDSRWAIGRKRTPSGHPDNPMKVAKIFFREPDYYIHGTDKEVSIGERDSHGCLRMTENDVAELGRFLMEHGGRPMRSEWFDAVLQRKRPTVVRLRHAVPFTIVK